MSQYDFDLIVIGVGSGGISSANLALKLGKKVAVVEKARIGGDCTWYGCVPSKALIRSAAVAHHIGHMGDYGLQTRSPVLLDTDHVMEHVRSIRQRVYRTEEPAVFEDMGIRVYLGAPEFIDDHRIQSMIHIYPTYGDLVKRPATAAFADKLQSNFFVKQLRRFAS